METVENPGAGYFLPGVWGCPPDLKIPQEWGIKGLIETISVVSFVSISLLLLYRNGDDLGEGGRIPYRHVGKHLAIDINPGLIKAVDEPAIGETMLTGSGINTDDPQPSEIALSIAAMAIGIAQGLQHRLVGDAVAGVPCPHLSLGELQYLLMTAMGSDAAFYPSHLYPP